MVKKFKKWRDNLTLSQAHKIMWILAIITEILITLDTILNREQLTKILENEIPIWLHWLFISGITIGMLMVGMGFVLNTMDKEIAEESELKEKEISPQLKEDEFTEIYLKQRPRRNVSKVILDGYDAHEKRYFAKKEDDEIYVIMKEDESVIKDYHTSNYSFFDYHFTFTKEEK